MIKEKHFNYFPLIDFVLFMSIVLDIMKKKSCFLKHEKGSLSACHQ